MKYKIEISGRGGEIAIGSVKREFYDAILDKDIDFDEYAWNNDFFEENEEVEISEEIRPFEPGEWFECDNIAHHSGPALDDSYVTILDESGEVVHDALTIDQFLDLGSDTVEVEEIYPQETLEDGEVYFIGQSFEKGHFLTFECEDESFDPKKLVFNLADCDGWSLVVGASYEGEILDDLGELSTTGKGSEFQLILVEKD